MLDKTNDDEPVCVCVCVCVCFTNSIDEKQEIAFLQL
jgi:hypothetical protein